MNCKPSFAIIVALILMVAASVAGPRPSRAQELNFTDISVGRSVTGTVDANAQNQQWYRLTKEALGLLELTLQGDSDGDLDLEVYSEDGTLLAQSNAIGSDEHITLTTDARHVFFIKVFAYGQTERTTYTLAAAFREELPAARLNGEIRGHVDATAPVQLYRLRVEGSGDLVVTLDGDDITTDLDLEVLGGDQHAWLGSSTMAGNEEMVTVNCRRYYDYLVKVRTLGGGDDFTLRTAYRDQFEELGANAIVRRTVNQRQREQIFQISDPPKGYLLVDLEGSGGSDMDLQITGADGASYTSAGQSSNEKLLVSATPGNPLRIIVSLYNGDGGEFALNTDHITRMQSLPLNKPVHDAVNFFTNRIDLYRLAPDQDGVVEVAMVGARDGEDLDIYLYNRDGALLDFSRNEGSSTENFMVPLHAHENYFLAVVAFSSDDDNSYTLTATLNDQISATSADVNQTQPGMVNSSTSPYHCYRFSIPEDGVFSLKASAFNYADDVDLEVCTRGGSEKISNEIGGLEQVVLNVTAGDVVYARVWGYQLHRDAHYLLTANLYQRGDLRSVQTGLGPQLWGVFSGVQDYREIGDLSFTSADAVEIYRCFTERGDMPAANTFLLIDEEATHDNLKRAIRAAADKADADDILVIFFSGHGGSGCPDQASQPDESDGMDEFICAWDSNRDNYDGDVLDDELRDWLSETDAGLVLVILDTCFSGGFESDLMTRTGVMGIFSSQEDKTSEEAATFRAGILSHTVVAALSGQADVNGDHIISAEELEDYILTMMPQICPVCKQVHPVGTQVCPVYHIPLTGEYRRQHPETGRLLEDDVPLLVLQ